MQKLLLSSILLFQILSAQDTTSSDILNQLDAIQDEITQKASDKVNQKIDLLSEAYENPTQAIAENSGSINNFVNNKLSDKLGSKVNIDVSDIQNMNIEETYDKAVDTVSNFSIDDATSMATSKTDSYIKDATGIDISTQEILDGDFSLDSVSGDSVADFTTTKAQDYLKDKYGIDVDFSKGMEMVENMDFSSLSDQISNTDITSIGMSKLTGGAGQSAAAFQGLSQSVSQTTQTTTTQTNPLMQKHQKNSYPEAILYSKTKIKYNKIEVN